MREKNATLSPYNSGDTDARTFPDTDGEILTAEKFIALADDVQAIVDRIVAVEAGGGGGGVDSGGFDIPYTEISAAGLSGITRAGRCEWYKDAQGIVHARIVITDIGSSGTTGLTIAAGYLFSQGLPEPIAIGTLSPALGRMVPVSAVSSPDYVKYARMDSDDLGDGFEIALASSVALDEVHASFSYPTL